MPNATMPTTDSGKIAAAVKRLMERKDLTCAQMCDGMGIQKARLSTLLSGRSTITDLSMDRFANALGLKKSTILREAGL